MIALVLLAGCTGLEGGCAESDTPTLTVGVGENAYTSHIAGDRVPLIHGPQGGVHITLAVETTGFNLSEDLMASIEGTIDGQVLATASPFVFLRCNNQTSTQQAWDLRLIYDEEPALLDEQLTDVTFVLTDADGREATASTTFIIDDPTI